MRRAEVDAAPATARVEGAVRWAAAHAVEVAFVAMSVAWLAYMLRINGGMSFWGDDLRLIQRAGSWGRLLDPYNGHMSVLILGLYRGLAEVAGLSYGPYSVVGVVALVAVPVAYLFTARGRLGAPAAALLALPLLLRYDAQYRLAISNHYMVIIAAFAAGAALNRGRRADPVLAVAVLVALGAAGGGLVVAAACLLHNLLSRAPARRWAAVLVPLGVWGLWWLVVADRYLVTAAGQMSVGEVVEFLVRLGASPFLEAALGNRALAVLLAAGFAAYAVSRLRRGVAASANLIAWSAAVPMWGLALVRSRGDVDAGTFRYSYVAMGFALLAVVPRERVDWAWLRRLASRPRWTAAAAAALLVLGAARGVAVRDDMQAYARQQRARGRAAEGTILAARLGDAAVPDDMPITFFGYFVHQDGEVLRSLLERYGGPGEGITADVIDRELVRRRVADIVVHGGTPPRDCEELSGTFLDPGQHVGGLGVPRRGSPQRDLRDVPLRLWTPEPVTIWLRRFGTEWIEASSVPAKRQVVLTLPFLDAVPPWQLRADGACMLGDGWGSPRPGPSEAGGQGNQRDAQG